MALVGKNRMDSVARIMTSINALAALALIYDLPVEDFLDTVLVTTNVANIILMAIEFGFIAFVVAIYNAVQGFRTRLKTAVRSQQAMHQTRGEDLAEAAIEDDSVTIHEMIMADNAGASVVDLNFARENGKTPLHMAVELDNVEVAKMLCKVASLQAKNIHENRLRAELSALKLRKLRKRFSLKLPGKDLPSGGKQAIIDRLVEKAHPKKKKGSVATPGDENSKQPAVDETPCLIEVAMTKPSVSCVVSLMAECPPKKDDAEGSVSTSWVDVVELIPRQELLNFFVNSAKFCTSVEDASRFSRALVSAVREFARKKAEEEEDEVVEKKKLKFAGLIDVARGKGKTKLNRSLTKRAVQLETFNLTDDILFNQADSCNLKDLSDDLNDDSEFSTRQQSPSPTVTMLNSTDDEEFLKQKEWRRQAAVEFGILSRRTKVLIALMEPFVVTLWHGIKELSLHDAPKLGVVAEDLIEFAVLRLSQLEKISIKGIGLTGATLHSVALVLHNVRVQLRDGFLIYGNLVAGCVDDCVHVASNIETKTVVHDLARKHYGRKNKVHKYTGEAVVLVLWESTQEAHDVETVKQVWMDEVLFYRRTNKVVAVILVGLENGGAHMFDAIDMLETPCISCSMAAGTELLERGAAHRTVQAVHARL